MGWLHNIMYEINAIDLYILKCLRWYILWYVYFITRYVFFKVYSSSDIPPTSLVSDVLC